MLSFSSNSSSINIDELEATIADFEKRDDVYSSSFLSTIVINNYTRLAESVEEYLHSIAATILYHSGEVTSLPSGPYLFHPSGNITKVYRLYWDYNFAFETPVVEGHNGSYVPLTGAVDIEANGALSVAVPSRLYYPPPSKEKPLSGKRLVVKDNYDLKGIRTVAGSRAIRQLSSPANDNAPSLQKLIDLGAVVVGKVKTTQVALGEVPADFVDQLAPFNPRGDNYQSPAFSSCGTGAGVASYDWLDFGTASDTGGSIRLPSKANGLFGLRVTNESLSTAGIMPQSPIFDVPGLLSRSALLLQTAYTHWLSSKPYTRFPRRIILPTEFWPTENATSMPVFESFLSKLSTYLNATLDEVSTNSSFKTHTHHSEGIQPFLQSAYSNITNYDQVRLWWRPFNAAYKSKFGRSPYIGPVPASRIERGETLTQDLYDDALARVGTYRSWFRQHVLPSCEEAILVYPLGAGLEEYRDIYPEPPSAVFGGTYPATFMSVLSGVPDYAVPIGIMTAAGCDKMLVDLVAKMSEKGLLVGEVKAGQRMY
ncbi:hypothetical protein CkaCkLH20_05258 [Colletotrichum karsti]|uniref:Amidase domain-containing protein n=1 Tax=Colletotrichum karsti TaxID=1095194 RepID=A0A9P6LLW7_9PEZI|nr:uncharacterized protein CkaCkLH20_05258 [Colletotrichum karsti]KAF9876992.1 hypothetical protein CkaCkLH20_05258 [Colletotrichum karsti]